jgi:anti-sigma regulatory factor (Ser/Thr protein kinase)
MSGGTGAVPARCGAARLAPSAEQSSGAGTAVQSWPLETHLPLHALPTAPGCARDHVRAVACEWGLSGLAETAELLVSELVTNALYASERSDVGADKATVPVVQLWIVTDGISLVIYVWDNSDAMPVRQDAGPDQIGGRGLMLVEALGKEWGAYRLDSGKVVWVMLAADP